MDRVKFWAFATMLRGALLGVTAWIDRYMNATKAGAGDPVFTEFLQMLRTQLIEIVRWVERNKAGRGDASSTSTPPAAAPMSVNMYLDARQIAQVTVDRRL